MGQQLSTNTFGVAKWVVSPDPTQGTHTTIQAAVNAASSGDTIYVRDGTYTETITLKSGLNIIALQNNTLGAPAVSIVGKFTDNGVAVNGQLTGFKITTNSDYAISVTGASTDLVFNYCNIIASNNTAINLGNAGATVNLDNCSGNILTTGIAFWTGSGAIGTYNSQLLNSGATTTASTTTGSTIISYSSIEFPIGTTSTGQIAATYTIFDTSGINTTAITTAGSSLNKIEFCYFLTGSASSISIGAGTTVEVSYCSFSSTNTNVLTGAGGLEYAYLSFLSTSSGHNVTTETALTTLPNSAAFTQTNIQTFTANGTYTPTSGMKYCIIEALGGGGGGGSAPTTGAGNTAAGGAGGAGERAIGSFSAASIGVSQTVTIGAAGTGGAAGSNPGVAGGNTSVGALISANGGSGGNAGTGGTVSNSPGAAGGTGGTGGSARGQGAYGLPGFSIGTTGPIIGGGGGNSLYGQGGKPVVGGSNAGNAASGNGAGGGAAVTFASAQQAGGAGTAGIVIITEYI